MLLAFVSTACALLAADISGTWNMEVQTDQGSGSPVFVLKQAGEKLSGTYEGTLGKAEVRGSVKGSEVILEFDTDALGDKATVQYRGRLEGDSKMKGTVKLGDFGGTFSGVKK